MNKYKNHSKVKESFQYRQCFSKKQFDTREGAILHNKGQHPYECTICKKWHLSGSLMNHIRKKYRPIKI